jgi:hypothetical protein
MSTPDQTASVSKAVLWTGRVFTALPVAMLLFSAAGKFSGAPELAKGFEHLGWPIGLAFALGVVELVATVLYAIPRTSVLGAILITGYLGGAIATHVRIGEPFILQALFGVLAWGGLYLRDPRLRVLIPLRR